MLLLVVIYQLEHRRLQQRTIISSGQDVNIFGTLGKKQINVKSGEIAEIIANKINTVAGDTGRGGYIFNTGNVVF